MSYTEPLITAFLIICVWAGVRRRKGRKLLLAGLAGLCIISWPPAEWIVSRPLEAPYPVRPFRSTLQPQAIVVLGGAISPPDYEREYPLPDTDTYEHCAMAAWVHKQFASLPVLACEGSHGKYTFPSAMREILMGAGVPDNLIWIEERSHNTHENAVFGARILRSQGITDIVLVTDAQSMRRASASFRKQGLKVIPAPCAFGQLELSSRDLLPNWRAVRRSERDFHELLGLAWYSMRGWI